MTTFIPRVLFLMLMSTSAFALASNSLTLTARYSHASPEWKAELTFSNPTACQIKLSEYSKGPNKIQTHALSQKDCDSLWQSKVSIEKELKTFKQRHVFSEVADEPSYFLRSKGVEFQVPFEAPGVCEASATGDLKCRSHSLSKAQEVLLYLRGQVQELRSVRK